MMSKEDPFAMIFINPEDIKKQIALKLAKCFKEKNQERLDKKNQLFKKIDIPKNNLP